MNQLVSIVGVSGVGKTALVEALSRTERFVTAYETHADRPFQALFRQDPRYALANQIDYFLLRVEQERSLRTAGPGIGLMDGGLDLDIHGFTRLFHSRGLLSDPEYALCRRLYAALRVGHPPPELFVYLRAQEQEVVRRLSVRDRINIARPEDTALFQAFLDEWVETLPADRLLTLDGSRETLGYDQSVRLILERLDR
jgi:deoxyadenosine/deoxycytidine kinase